jgi:prepilin-type N-terminal cleavage/methylation domain-containing protein
MKHAHHRGFTFIELIIVVGLIGILLTFSMVMSFSSISRSSVIQERDLFVALLLTGTRAKAIANVEQKPHGIHIDNICHRYILFVGNPPTPTLPSDGTCTPKDSREILFTNTSLNVTSTGGNTIVFAQLSGDVLAGIGTLTFAQGSTTQEVEISSAGRINW